MLWSHNSMWKNSIAEGQSAIWQWDNVFLLWGIALFIQQRLYLQKLLLPFPLPALESMFPIPLSFPLPSHRTRLTIRASREATSRERDIYNNTAKSTTRANLILPSPYFLMFRIGQRLEVWGNCETNNWCGAVNYATQAWWHLLFAGVGRDWIRFKNCMSKLLTYHFYGRTSSVDSPTNNVI